MKKYEVPETALVYEKSMKNQKKKEAEVKFTLTEEQKTLINEIIDQLSPKGKLNKFNDHIEFLNSLLDLA